jgi:pyruvate, orthophosphate dikinase
MCKRFSPWKLRVNAESKADLDLAKEFMANGVGVCRTEHMFLGEGRIELSWRLISNAESSGKVMKELYERQTADFEEIFESMPDKPITIRLLDPPLHEFFPRTEEDFQQMALSLEPGFRQ